MSKNPTDNDYDFSTPKYFTEELVVEKTPEEILSELEQQLIDTNAKYLLLQADYQNKKRKSDEINSKAKTNGINETFDKMQKPLLKLTSLKTSDEEFKKGIDMIINNTQMRLETIGLSIFPGGSDE